MTRKKYARLTTSERLSLWQEKLAADEQRRILEWSQRLGHTDYDLDPLPVSVRESLAPGVAEPQLRPAT